MYQSNPPVNSGSSILASHVLSEQTSFNIVVTCQTPGSVTPVIGKASPGTPVGITILGSAATNGSLSSGSIKLQPPLNGDSSPAALPLPKLLPKEFLEQLTVSSVPEALCQTRRILFHPNGSLMQIIMMRRSVFVASSHASSRIRRGRLETGWQAVTLCPSLCLSSAGRDAKMAPCVGRLVGILFLSSWRGVCLKWS